MPTPFEQLKEKGLRATRARSQNFLRDPVVSQRIAALIMEERGEGTEILEIGPGLGAITMPLISLGAKVTAVELDRGLAQGLRENLKFKDKDLRVINQDILKLDVKSLGAGPYLIVGNLPYNISSPVLFWFLENFPSSKGVFMLQKDLVLRIMAKVGGKDYGRITVGLSPFFHLKSPFDVGSHAFQPRPKVTSSILSLTPKEDSPKINPRDFGRFTAICFHSRRKTLANNLSMAFGRERAQRHLLEFNLKTDIRPEELEALKFVELFRAFRTEAPQEPPSGAFIP
ncbi:MAG: 16S rRNA (adenine(1518)-N(6)/adenine(1519)-N(6))-dimethyltransferase RsmA [Deltaproteobacteria bacterium]|nr:16S rRNA (adenine(1518)-N(6)/adenine(1519)-N(6))-dimethyltransferase RsmA [Deltaproteobacteria bacterium]